MNLRKQIILSFIVVAMVPLLIVNVYLFWSNTQLAFHLYQQNLNNSASIHTDIIEEHINRMMVRAQGMASALERGGVMAETQKTLLKNPVAADEILKFTEETLDSILVFALLNAAGDVVYSSGSKSDTRWMKDGAAALPRKKDQYVGEITLGDESCNIAVVTPVRPGGRLIAIYRNDFFLKAISSHAQIESSNAFFYCRAHGRLVAAKKPVQTEDFGRNAGSGEAGKLACRINGEEMEAYFLNIAKTPWVLVNSIPFAQVYSHVIRNMTIAGLLFLACLVVVVFLSRRQSARILQPMNWLIEMVERFFRTGKADFSNTRIEGKTEIGYLAEKFKGMASDMAAVQATLRESNYLYEAILRSSYEASITIDYQENSLETTLDQADFPRGKQTGEDAPQRALRYFHAHGLTPGGESGEDSENDEWLRAMIYGRMNMPVEGDVGMRTAQGEERWYRIVAVPIIAEDGQLLKTVLHLKNITAQKQQELLLLRSAQRDPLCGLLNKSTLLELADQRVDTSHGVIATFFVDLDNFKQVNDRLGHAAGDAVLLATADVLKEVFRSTDLICRYGGDEFVVFADGLSSNAAHAKAERLVRALSFSKPTPEGDMIMVSASVGVWISHAGEKAEAMIQRADQMMYKAKQGGKSQYALAAELSERQCDGTPGAES